MSTHRSRTINESNLSEIASASSGLVLVDWDACRFSNVARRYVT